MNAQDEATDASNIKESFHGKNPVDYVPVRKQLRFLVFTHRRNGSARCGYPVETRNMLSDEESSGPEPHFFQINVNDRSEEERHDLREKEAACYRYAQGPS